MKKQSIFLGVILAMTSLVSFADAATYVDIPANSILINSATSHQYTFDLSADFSTITAASLVVWVKDDNDTAYDRFSISAGSPLNNIYTYDNKAYLTNISTQYPAATPWDVTSMIVGKQLSVKIQEQKSNGADTDFYFDKFVLTVTGTPAPIPGAAWLLGTGLIGLVVIRRGRK